MDYEYLDEQSINTQVFMQLLRRAFIKCELDDDGDIQFEMDGYRGYIEIDTERKIIRFLMLFSLQETATELEKLEMVNKLNSNIIFNKFYINKNGIYSSYHLLFEQGLPSYQFMASLKKFMNITIRAFADKDIINF